MIPYLFRDYWIVKFGNIWTAHRVKDAHIIGATKSQKEIEKKIAKLYPTIDELITKHLAQIKIRK